MIKKLHEAQGEEQKQAARADLRNALAEIFDADMQSRETQAQEIQRRLDKLHQQYEARKKVKDQILDLQLKVLESEAEGLGFPRGEVLSDTSRTQSQRTGRPNFTLEEFKKIRPAVVSQLTELGHFAESPNGKLYAYVNSNRPMGPSELVVMDAASGRVVMTGDYPKVLGAIEFTDEGIAERDERGSLQLLFPLTELNRPVPITRSGGPSHQEFVAEYNLLRDQYVKAKADLQNAERVLQSIKPDSLDDVRKKNPRIFDAVEKARADWAAVNQLLETKLSLIELDFKQASITAEAARKQFSRTEQLHQKSSVSTAELDAQKATLEAAELEVARVEKLRDLFKSIQDAAPPATDPSATSGAENRVQQYEKAFEMQSQLSKLKATGGRYRTGISTEKPIDIAGHDGDVRINPGETKLIQLPKATTEIEWRWGDITEKVEDPEPFDYVLVEWEKQLVLTFYHTQEDPAAP